jgi:hypothetical protein
MNFDPKLIVFLESLSWLVSRSGSKSRDAWSFCMTLAALSKRSQSLHDTLLLVPGNELASMATITVHEKMACTIAWEERSQSSEIRGRELALVVYMALVSTWLRLKLVVFVLLVMSEIK